MITIRDLELVRALAKFDSLTEAARSLHITQSAASQRLKSLNERLATTVFNRRRGRLEITAAGRRLQQAADVVTGEIDSALLDLRNLATHQQDTLRIATQCYTCYRWLPFVIRSMGAAFPRVAVDVVPEATDRPYDALANDEIDVAIVSNPQDAPTFRTLDLFDDELYAVVHANHPLATRKILAPRDFSGQTLILYTGRGHAIVDAVLKPNGVTDYDLVQVRITEAIIELARAGRGIAVLAGWALDDIVEKQGLVTVRITRRGFKRTWRAVVAPNETPPLERLIAQLRRVGDSLAEPNWRSTLADEFRRPLVEPSAAMACLRLFVNRYFGSRCLNRWELTGLREQCAHRKVGDECGKLVGVPRVVSLIPRPYRFTHSEHGIRRHLDIRYIESTVVDTCFNEFPVNAYDGVSDLRNFRTKLPTA